MEKENGCYGCGDETRLLGGGFSKMVTETEQRSDGKQAKVTIEFTTVETDEPIILCPMCVGTILANIALSMSDVQKEAKSSNSLS